MALLRTANEIFLDITAFVELILEVIECDNSTRDYK